MLKQNVPGYVCNPGSLRERDAALNILGMPVCSHALKYVFNLIQGNLR